MVAILTIGVSGYFIAQKNVNPSGYASGVSSETDGEFSWKLDSVDVDERGIERTKITLLYDRQTYDVGISIGTCEVRGAVGEWQKQDANEVTWVTCWHMGGGSEFGVFEQEGTYVVKEMYLDTTQSSNPNVGVRAELNTITTIE